MIPFTDAARYEYDLAPSSVVIDCGGYEGNFAKIIAEKYGCTVHVLEPVKRFRDSMHRGPRIGVHPYGVAAVTREATFHVAGDSSGEWTHGLPNTETVKLLAISDVLGGLAPNGCDLLKLNIEGAEFEVLESLLSHGLIIGKEPNARGVCPSMNHIRDLQVQFHHGLVPDSEARYEAIAAGLSLTHELTWRHPWVWENWRRK